MLCSALLWATLAWAPVTALDDAAAVTRSISPHGVLPAEREHYSDPVSTGATPHRVTRAFDIPQYRWQPGHRGVDLAAQPGAAIHAAGAGIVAWSGVIAGQPGISIDHSDGIRTTYQPVFASVRAGDVVARGQVIGTLAPSDGQHEGLHWGARTGPDTYINPLLLLAEPVIRLKAWN